MRTVLALVLIVLVASTDVEETKEKATLADLIEALQNLVDELIAKADEEGQKLLNKARRYIAADNFAQKVYNTLLNNGIEITKDVIKILVNELGILVMDVVSDPQHSLQLIKQELKGFPAAVVEILKEKYQ